MNTLVSPAQAGPVPRAAGRLANFRLIPRIDTYPAVISFAQTIAGKVVLLVLFGAGLAYTNKHWLMLTLCLALTTFFPARRRLLVTVSTLIFMFVVPWKAYQNPVYALSLIACAVALGLLLFWFATLWPRSWYGRRPVLLLLSAFAILIVVAAYIPRGIRLNGILWDFAEALSAYLWFICYSLLDRNASGRDPVVLQLGTYHPFWGSSHTPFPKGAAYLRRIEARDSREFAVIQLKGLKLLAWSILISLFGILFNKCTYVYLKIPTFAQALSLSVNRTPLPWYICWGSLLAGFFGGIISLSAVGHQVIAGCRMAGFNALRNTYRPLSSRTVAEFFNRYYFYFKELLVDVFFYPFFFKFFKKHHKLRLVGAIFAAACFGNAFYHFARDLTFVQQLGLGRALAGYQVYVFYCILLASAISVSQLRHRRPASPGFIRGQLWPSFLVVLFFCLLDVFGSTERNYPLVEHLRFLAHLFNLNL